MVSAGVEEWVAWVAGGSAVAGLAWVVG